jgi:tRNA threonylcarbamoyladenosine biosynthesis protein TsaE
MSVALADEAATRLAGARLARALASVEGGVFVTLAGELGAGKTTLTRGLLEAVGVTGPVRSPTYTLVESYVAGGRTVHHFDWYRLGDADELEALGFRDLGRPDAWIVAEWPERIPEAAARADLALHLTYAGVARQLDLEPRTAVGRAVAAAFMTAMT